MSCERLCAYARRKLHHTNCHPSNDASMSESDRRRQSIVLSLWSTHNKIFAISVSLANEVDGVTEWEPALFETSESFLSSLVWMRKFNVARNHDFFCVVWLCIHSVSFISHSHSLRFELPFVSFTCHRMCDAVNTVVEAFPECEWHDKFSLLRFFFRSRSTISGHNLT